MGESFERFLLQIASAGAARTATEIRNLRLAIQEVILSTDRVTRQTTLFRSSIDGAKLAIIAKQRALLAYKSSMDQARASIQGAGTAKQGWTDKVRTGVTSISQFTQAILNTARIVKALTIDLAQQAIEWAKLGGSVIGAKRFFAETSKSIGVTADSLLVDLRKASMGTISDLDLMRAANFAFLGGAKLTREELLILAEASAKLGGVVDKSSGAVLNAEEVFRRFTQAIIKQERRLVDEMTVVIRAKDVFEDFAASINKSTDALTAEEKVFAFRKAVVEAASEKLETLKNVSFDNVLAGQQAAASFENFKNELAEVFVKSGAAAQILEILKTLLTEIKEKIFADPGKAKEFFDTIILGIKAVVALAKILFDLFIALKPVIDAILKAIIAIAESEIGRILALTAAGALKGFAVGGVPGAIIGGGLGLGAGILSASEQSGTNNAKEVSKVMEDAFEKRDLAFDREMRNTRNSLQPSYFVPVVT